MKRLAAVILSTIVLFSMGMGCAKKEIPGSDSDKEIELIPDINFGQGFVLTGFDSRPEFGERHIGEIDYGLDNLTPVWRIGQWGCRSNLVDAKYTTENGTDVFKDGSKVLKINRDTGAYSLNVDASTDGVYDGGVREENEPWIHFILEIPQFPDIVMLKDLDYLTFYLEFKLTKAVNQCGDDYDPNLHSSMFLWYITLNDMANPSEYFWFGLPIYDNRHAFSPEFAQQDGGKEDATTAFIYNPGAETFLNAPVTLNVPSLLSQDMLPTIQYAFKLAQERGFMKKTKYENLGISLMYIGWELPGTFDVGVDVHDMHILAGKK